MGQQLAFSGASRKDSTQFLNAWAWEIGAQKADLGAVAASSLLTGSFGQVVSNKLWSPEQKKKFGLQWWGVHRRYFGSLVLQ